MAEFEKGIVFCKYVVQLFSLVSFYLSNLFHTLKNVRENNFPCFWLVTSTKLKAIIQTFFLKKIDSAIY